MMASATSVARREALRYVVVRPESREDEPALLAIHASTRAHEMALVDWTDAQKDAFLRMQFDAQLRHYRATCPGAAFQVIECDGEVVGRYYVHVSDSDVRVIDISLLPHVRGRGIATMLLSRTIAEAGARGCRVSLHVEIENPARRLYERLGFRAVQAHGFRVLMSTIPGRDSGA